ncbi:hypothetical protein HID58_094201 [Brassica napus]|uniref:Uncharacterized protein n=1 Tax=Brassica napus TaxID=3708 RepID=A0ABQ7XAD9_BRANA|nr:hypothetical protein HID58_094201 [Brassica napus]
MDNFLPFSSSNANSVEELSMDLNNNRSRLSTFPTYDHHHQAQHHSLQPYSYVACPVDQTAAMNPQISVIQTGSEFGSLVCNPGFRQARGGFLDPHTAKMARINRKKAMIRSRNNSSPNSSSNELVGSRRQVVLTMKNNAEIAARKDLYRYSSFDNKKLRVLLVKHLKNSDVGSLGRIVLPKREAEGNLPELSTKEGMIVEMRDADSMQNWFWSNNKSRMYVLENTAVRMRKYFSIRKHADKPNEGREDESMEANDMNFYEDIAFDFIPKMKTKILLQCSSEI